MNATIIANGKEVRAEVPATLEAFLVQQGLSPRGVVVEQNGQAVSPSEFPKREVHAGDKLEIVKVVAGG